MFGAVYTAEESLLDVLVSIGREFTPRLEVPDPGVEGRGRDVVLDLAGLSRMFGDPWTLAAAIRRSAAARGLEVRVALAGTQAAARLLVRHRAGITIVPAGSEAAALAGLPVTLLDALIPARAPAPAHPRTCAPAHLFLRWGLRTLGDVAALPAAEVASRLGQEGVAWQVLARGGDLRPLVPSVPEERFAQALDLDWPIEGLEPLSFVLGRLMEPLSAHLVRRGCGAAVLRVQLVQTRQPEDDAGRRVHERSLQLPVPIHDARTLRTLALLDLESHPPQAPVERVVVAVDPAPAQVVQFSLITRPLPSPEHLSTLIARLTALAGDARCGSPAESDSWEPGAFAIVPFAPLPGGRVPDDRGHAVSAGSGMSAGAAACVPVVALRRFRVPVPARVQVEAGRPVRVAAARRGVPGGRVLAWAGPWRTSGGWWQDRARAARGAWDRDEWEVALSEGAVCRVFRERETGRWFIEGVVD